MPPRLAFVAVALILAGSIDSRGDERPPGPVRCRDITDDVRRLACYDEQAARAAPEQPVQEQPRTTPEALFGMEPNAATALLQRQQGDEPLQSLEQAVATVGVDRNGKLHFVLANGQQWVQIDSGRMRLNPGDVVRIQRAALGSHLLVLPDSGRSIRVRRVDAP